MPHVEVTGCLRTTGGSYTVSFLSEVWQGLVSLCLAHCPLPTVTSTKCATMPREMTGPTGCPAPLLFLWCRSQRKRSALTSAVALCVRPQHRQWLSIVRTNPSHRVHGRGGASGSGTRFWWWVSSTLESYSCLDGSSVYCVDTRGHKVSRARADYSLLRYTGPSLLFLIFFLINYSLVSFIEDRFISAISEIGPIWHRHPKTPLLYLSRFKLFSMEWLT